jgi:ribosome-associated toxin RatA of RatAB toxin-antitoxin module
MADQASQSVTIAASPEQCFAVVTDFERYPEWAKDVKEATVNARDPEGRATEVEFRTSALGRSTHYVLSYDYTAAPAAMSWRMIRGDIMRSIDGAYTFEPSRSLAGGTDVTYKLAIELVVPLPGFVKRRAEVRILNSVRELKVRVEQA